MCAADLSAHSLQIDGNPVYSCIKKGCPWVEVGYNPLAVRNIMDINKTTKNNPIVVPTCKDSNVPNTNSGNLYGPVVVAQDALGIGTLSLTEYVDLARSASNQSCYDLPNCLYKLSMDGLEQAQHYGSLNLSNFRCQGELNCQEVLPTMNDLYKRFGPTGANASVKDKYGYYLKTSCPAKQIDGTDSPECCYDINKNFNGKVCPYGYCYSQDGGKTHSCYGEELKGTDIPLNNCGGNNNGNFVFGNIPNTVYCQCKSGYAGNQCQFSNSQCGYGTLIQNTDNTNGVPTYNAGVKIGNITYPVCKCNPGFTGVTCDKTINITKTGFIRPEPHSTAGCNGIVVVCTPGVTISGYRVFGSTQAIGDSTIPASTLTFVGQSCCSDTQIDLYLSSSIGTARLHLQQAYCVLQAGVLKVSAAVYYAEPHVNPRTNDVTPIQTVKGTDTEYVNFFLGGTTDDRNSNEGSYLAASYGNGDPSVIFLGMPLI